MRRIQITMAVIILLCFVILLGLWRTSRHVQDRENPVRVGEESHAGSGYSRIISLAPSITEVLFALGLGDRVAGVTRYCDYPPEAAGKIKVGGYFDVNYEAVLTADPDLVILLKEHEQPRDYLARLDIETFTVDHSSVDGILRSIGEIARKTGSVTRANEIVADLRMRIERISRLTEGLERPRVMVAVGRNMETDVAGEVYVSGKDGFYDELITMAGGVNAYDRTTLKFPAVSAEGVARLNPQIILEMVPDMDDEAAAGRILEQWRSIPGVDAIRDGRVHLFARDYAVVPGPRFILLLEWMARVIQPDAEWDEG